MTTPPAEFANILRQIRMGVALACWAEQSRPVIDFAAVPSACHRGHTQAGGMGHAPAVPTRSEVGHPDAASQGGHECGAAGRSQAPEEFQVYID